MANFTKMLLLVFAIQLILTFTGVITTPASSLSSFLESPESWKTDTFPAIFSNLLLIGGGVLFGAGLLFERRLVVFSGISIIFLGFGATLYSLWSNIAGPTGTNTTIALIFVSPLLLLYLLLLVSWWREKAD